MIKPTESNVLVSELYPIVANSLDKNTSKFKSAIGSFLNDHAEQINDVGLYDIIYYAPKDKENMFLSLGIKEADVLSIIMKSSYYNTNMKPLCAREPYVLVCIMAIRYFLIKKLDREAELTSIYLAFSGKFYASIFAKGFPTAPPSKHKSVMEYVINNMLSEKHSLKSEGTVFKAIKAMCNTYLQTYNDTYKKSDISDDEFRILVQQLRDREKSFISNIVRLYYEAYENKLYLNYETDNFEDGASFRLTTNDSLKAAAGAENALNYMVSNSVSLQICNKCKDENVKATEIKDIMEAIISDKNNLNELFRVINILICDFFRNYPGKSINSIEFIAYSIKAKPNTKDKYILEVKTTILSWLDENSPNYRRRKNRKATAISYYKAILSYIVLCITYANK